MKGRSTTDTPVLRHVVLFAYRDGTTDAESAEIARRFAALAEEIDGVVGFEQGPNVSSEVLNDGLTHCHLMSFESEAARDTYLPHSAHKAFVDFASRWIAKALVVDYWA